MRRFIFIVLLALVFARPVFADGTYAGIGTGDGTDGGADAINFSQGRVWVIDNYGKYIWITENRSGVHHFTFSNDSGSTWTQGSEATNFMQRGSVAYDSINDKLHVIWTTGTCDSGGGIIYRRYGITRDGSHNITDVNREDAANVNLQLDLTGSVNCFDPLAIWNNDGTTNGTLLAFWAKQNSGASEIRGSMRHLSLSAADGTAGNWVSMDGTGDTFATNAPAVAADKIYTSASGSNYESAMIRGGSGARKNDLYVFVQEGHGSSADNLLAYRAIWNSGSTNWSGGWQSPITVGAADSSSGYSAKSELLTRPVLDDSNDRIYIGWARWKTGGSGDTWSIAYLNSTDTPSSTFDVYSANGTHAYAPTGDIMWDSTQGLIYTSYIESTTNGTNGSIDYKTFDGSSLGTQTRFYTTPGGSAGADGGADIPIMYDFRSNGRLLFAFRVNGALPPTAIDPHKIYFGYISLPTPTPTPTPAPTPTPVSAPSSPSGPFPAPVCTDSRPMSAPDLFQIDSGSTKAVLYFVPARAPVSEYVVSYGFGSGREQFGTRFDQGISTGVLNTMIGSLPSGTDIYFRIRAGNGCATGDWSNEMKITTTRGSGVTSYYKNFISRVLSYIPQTMTNLAPKTNTAASGSCQSYTVLPGDSLWTIAANIFGSGAKYSQIVTTNNLLSANLIWVGQKLKLNCQN